MSNFSRTFKFIGTFRQQFIWCLTEFNYIHIAGNNFILLRSVVKKDQVPAVLYIVQTVRYELAHTADGM